MTFKMESKESWNPEIVFICPRFYISRLFTHSLGISYIQAYLLQKGIYSLQIAQKDFSVCALVDDILRYNTRVVGISCYDTTYYVVKIIAQLLKKKRPGINIVIGGPTATFSDKLIMNDCPHIDFCIRGEGEHATYELIHSLRTHSNIENINGITYRRNKKITANPDRLLVRDNLRKDMELDALPSPYLSGILSGGENAGILSSRGCLFKCTYCSAPSMTQHIVRYHSIERIISEIRKISAAITPLQKNSYRVSFWDDNFASNNERSKRICRAIIDNKLNDLNYYCELRADRTDKELLELLFKAGFRHVNFGLESAVPKVLRTVKKLHSADIAYVNLKREEGYLQQIKENVGLAKTIGMNPTVSIISGLPGESLKDGRETVEFVSKLGLKTYYHNHLILFPGTELFKTHRKYGLKIIKSVDILPCYVRHSYDLLKIPYGSNSFESKLYYIVSHYFTEIIFGSWGSLSDKGFFSYPAIIFDNFHRWNDDSIFEWIRKNAIISAPLCFVYDGDVCKPYFLKKLRKLMAANSIPTRDFYCLFTKNHLRNNIKSKKFELFTKAKSRHKSLYPFSFDIMPLSRIDKVNFKSKQSLEKESEVMVALDSREDVKMFQKLISLPAGDPEQSLLTKLIDLNASFLDGCRWQEKPCPALELKKMFVQEDHTIKPCMHGGIIAKIGDNRDKIVKRFKRKLEIETGKRGCRKCPVNETCSKCLYPYPMTVKEYCNMRRNYSQAGKITRLLAVIKDLELQRFMGFLSEYLS